MNASHDLAEAVASSVVHRSPDAAATPSSRVLPRSGRDEGVGTRVRITSPILGRHWPDVPMPMGPGVAMDEEMAS